MIRRKVNELLFTPRRRGSQYHKHCAVTLVTVRAMCSLRLLTDLNELDRLDSAGVLSFESIYARGCLMTDKLPKGDPEATYVRKAIAQRKTAQSNRLTSHLKLYFPQMLDWFEDLDTEMVCALLERWSTLEELHKVPSSTLRKFFRVMPGADSASDLFFRGDCAGESSREAGPSLPSITAKTKR